MAMLSDWPVILSEAKDRLAHESEATRSFASLRMTRGWLRVTLIACLVVLVTACAPEPRPAAPLHLETTPAGADTRLILVPASHIKLNARVKPALELADGTVLRFDSAELTADSAYFSAPPTALLPGRHSAVRGTVRASICENDAPVCRALVLEL
jgi:hypothetical protein